MVPHKMLVFYMHIVGNKSRHRTFLEELILVCVEDLNLSCNFSYQFASHKFQVDEVQKLR